MPKTYTAAGSATAGQVYTASAHNVIVTDVNNLIVKPACRLTNSSNLTGYTSGSAITFNTETYDTDDMHSTVSQTDRITIQTAGIYLVSGLYYATYTGTPTVTEIYAIQNGSLSNQVAFDNVDYGSAAGAQVLSGSGIASLGSGDYLTLHATLTGATSIVIQSTRSYFAATFLGRTS